MDNSCFLYNDKINEGINEMSFSTNVLEKYDNVVYHCSLYTFNANNQRIIENNLSTDGFLPDNIFNDSNKVFIVNDGVTTKFTIQSIKMENTYGNIRSPINVATYKISLKLTETFSCMLTNELEALAYLQGYNGYLFRPYWLEIWFSGYDHFSGNPVSRIPLPNSTNSLIYVGYFGNTKSHLESTGTTWDMEFTPTYNSLLTKNQNILCVSSSLKNDTSTDLNSFMKACANDMCERMLAQYAKNEKEEGEIRKIVGDYITIIIKDEDGKEISQKITSEDDISGNNMRKNQENHQTDERDYFTNICQYYLINSKKYKDHYAKYDIKPIQLEYYNNIPLYKYIITLYIVKDEYMNYQYQLSQGKSSDYDPYKEFMNCRGNNSLVKKYQYGFSGQDTAVIEVFNNYDNLYFMNGLPQTSYEYIQGNINNRNNNNNRDFPYQEKLKAPKEVDKLAGNLEDIYKEIRKSLSGEILLQMSNYAHIPEINNDLTNKNKSESTLSNSKKDEESIAYRKIWERLYKSGQMTETKFSILGDPYWIATSTYRVKSEIREDIVDALPLINYNVPNWRCVFIIKTSADQNDNYTNGNPTDYTFEYSLHATGIYIISSCESIFEDGKFTQKLTGYIDRRFINQDALR